MSNVNVRTDVYQSPLAGRYASLEMQRIFSDDRKFSTWRRLWVALAKAEQQLGLKVGGELITDEQIKELEAHIDDINYDVARAAEGEAVPATVVAGRADARRMEVEEVCSSDIREISPRRSPVTEDARAPQTTVTDRDVPAATCGSGCRTRRKLFLLGREASERLF